jgi:two-component system sensor histidine kinase TctE
MKIQIKSLRARLLLWIIPALMIICVWVSVEHVKSELGNAEVIQDRLLLGSAKIIAQQLKVNQDQIELTIPPAAFEMLETGSRDYVYHRVITKTGRLISGDFLPSADINSLKDEEYKYTDVMVNQQLIRVVTFAQPVFENNSLGPLIIQVGQTRYFLNKIKVEITQSEILRQSLIVALTVVLIFLALRFSLKPLSVLEKQILARNPGQLVEIELKTIPIEISKLMEVFNFYVSRLNLENSSHNRFIAEASHQLRTPLTVLNTQLAFARSISSDRNTNQVLEAAQSSLKGTVRLVNQLLAYAEAERETGQDIELQPIELRTLTLEVVESLFGLALDKKIDFGWECSLPEIKTMGNAHLYVLLATNLIENAIKYTPVLGVVTVKLGLTDLNVPTLWVQDSGPGIPLEHQEMIFERFYRVPGAGHEGTGLGLSIVKEVIDQMNARIVIHSSHDPSGTIFKVLFQPI